jgi:hypothetical protein
MRLPMAVVAILMLLLPAGCRRHSSRGAGATRVDRIWSEFHLTPPYSIVGIHPYLDGGSSQWVIRGSNWRTLTFCHDNGARPIGVRRVSLLYVPTLGDPKCAVAFRSARESTLVELLDLVAEERLSPAVTSRLDSIYRTGDRQGSYALSKTLKPNGQKAMGAYMFALGLKAQRVRGYWRSADDPSPEDSLLLPRER